MVKAYLRYEHSGAFGVIASGSCNVLYDAQGRQLFTGALESIAAWSLRQGTQVATLSPDLPSSSTSTTRAAAEVTQIAAAPGSSSGQLAAGYSDGTVRIWDTQTQTCLVTLSGHSGAVTALRFSRDGALLASGSADTSLVVWDVVAEAGLCRFKGHKDAITDLVLVHNGTKLISSSKDGCVKVWDIALQHCSQTLIGFKGEVWSLDADPQEQRVVAGCVDADLRVYVIRSQDETAAVLLSQQQNGGGAHSDDDDEPLPESLLAAAAAKAAAAAAGGAAAGQQQQQQRHHDLLVPMGSVRRTGQERVAMIRFSAGGQLLGVMGAGKGLEVFSVRAGDDALKKAKRRIKRRKEKGQKRAKTGDKATPGGGHSDEEEEQDGSAAAAGVAVQASDEFGSQLLMTLKHKLRSFSFNPVCPKGCSAQLALGLANNCVEVVDVKGETYDISSRLDLPGHRSDVRCLALTSDDMQLLSGSNAGCKLWSPTTGACLGSIDTGYALCCAYVPGNRHALVGTKEGAVQLIDVGACTVVHTEQAHSGPVWSLALLPDKSGFVTGSADKTIKFWTWTITTEQQQPSAADDTRPSKKHKKSKHEDEDEDAAAAAAAGPVVQRFGFKQTRQLEMADDVLCVRVSPDNKLLAASLLDATIKVYYLDSFKFFLSLYGHKLPAISLDISSDSTLLISGSADKNIKVWGLDFGDCHKSLFAHQDTITGVGFVRDTHYAFSVSKDRSVKYWDMDSWEMLLELPAHHGEVWALAVSQYGDFVVTGSHDRSIRRWERTSEPFFVEEEKERRLESLFEADLEQQQQQQRGALILGPQGGAYAAAGAGAAGDEGAAGAAGRKTSESVSAADAIMDALDVAAHETEKLLEHQAAVAAAKAASQPPPKAPPSNPLMLGLPAEAYVLRSVSSVRANDLEQALLLLPFADALKLLQWVGGWLAQGNQVELSCRVAALLLRLHHAQLTATPSARQTLVDLHKRMRAAVQGLKDTLGFNIAALRFLQRTAKDDAGVEEGDSVRAARAALLADGGDGLLDGSSGA